MRPDRACWSAGVLLLILQCSTVRPAPTPAAPWLGCVISCKHGWAIERQHLCRGDSRYFHDVRITGRNTVRGVDGTILLDNWITSEGETTRFRMWNSEPAIPR